MLSSVINIYFVIGFIFPLGLTFFKPSATIISPTLNPEIISIFLIVSIILNFNLLKADEIKTENKIAKNLRCLICQGQSVYDSDSEFAISLKLVIKNKIQQGLT